MSKYIIQTQDLTKAYGQYMAVDHLNLEVRPGDIFGFLGPNGAGKTTTIRMLLGLIRPTAGRALLFEQDIETNLRAILRRIGAIIESPVFYPYLSGRDNLQVLAAASGMEGGRGSQNRIDAVLELVDMRKQGNDPYHAYSLGMKERLGIGAALLADPELLLLDEPTNGLDPAGVHEIRELIPALASQGKTVFLTSHLLYEIQQVCNRVAVLYQGKLLQQGNVSDLLQDGEQLVVRLDTPEQAQQAVEVLEHARSQGSAWIGKMDLEEKEPGNPSIRIEAPTDRSAELNALLARQGLFVAELVANRASLEDFYLELTGKDKESSRQFDIAISTSSVVSKG